MEVDEFIYAALEAANAKLAAHNAGDRNSDIEEARSSSDSEVEKGAVIAEMKEKIALLQAQTDTQQDQIAAQREDLTMLRELVQKIQQSQVAATNTSDPENHSEVRVNL